MKRIVLNDSKISILMGLVVGGFVSLAMVLSVEVAAVIAISCIVFTLSAIVMHKSIGVFNLRRLSIPGFWYLTYIPMIYVPGVFVFLEQGHAARYSFIVAVWSALMTVPFGVITISLISGFKRVEIQNYYEAEVEAPTKTGALFYICLVIFALTLWLFARYLQEVATIPLLYILRNPGEYLELVQLREESFKLLESSFTYVYYLLRVLFYPFLIMIALGYYLQCRKQKWLLLFLASTFFGLLYASFSLAKLPVVAIVALVVLFYYIYRGGRVSRKFLLFSIIIALAFPIWVILASQYGMGVRISDVLLAIGKRLFYLPALVIYYYFEYFPHVHGFLQGRSIGKLAVVMGWEHFNAPNIVGQYAFPDYPETIHMNAGFIANLYADFGMFGVVFGGILAGALMQALNVYLVRRQKTVLNLAVYAFLIFGFWLLHLSPLNVVLASNGVALIVILPWLLMIVSDLIHRAARGVHAGLSPDSM